jgi:glucosyl-3-phosphoglycerate synthase
MVPSDPNRKQDAAFRGMERVLKNLPDVDEQNIVTDHPAEFIFEASRQFDLIVMGASARSANEFVSMGPVAERIMKESVHGVIVVKTSQPAHFSLESEEAGQTAISVLVDKWFAENTFHADEFYDLAYLLRLKQERGLSISLALPALNEEKTVGTVIQTIKDALIETIPLLDEIVLIDSNSEDSTRAIAQSLGVPVYIHQEVLPKYGSRRGKGEALWKSLYCTKGDIVIWLDTDIVNIHPRFAYGLIGPLLLRPDIQFVKGFYRRPLRVGDRIQAGGGGRVTELTARPLLNLFFPELSGVVQPLSGEYGGTRAALEQFSFFSGYGVEIGLLIDVLDKCGLNAIAQVDLQERIHHNQPLEALSKMSFAIIQAVIRKLESRYGQSILENVNTTMKLIRYEQNSFMLDIEEIAERDRPPMIELPEYRERIRTISQN